MDTLLDCAGGDLKADETAADYNQTFARNEHLTQGIRVSHVMQIINALQLGPRRRQAPNL